MGVNLLRHLKRGVVGIAALLAAVLIAGLAGLVIAGSLVLAGTGSPGDTLVEMAGNGFMLGLVGVGCFLYIYFAGALVLDYASIE